MKRRILLAVAIVGTVVVLVLLIPFTLRRMSWFSVRRIEVVGGRYVGPVEVARALKLKPKTNLFDPLTGLSARVLAMPGVREATVKRRLPGTLVVTIREAAPVALAPSGGRLALVDERGRLLPFDPTRVAEDLPIAAPDSGVTQVLERIRESDPALFDRIERADRERNTIVLGLASLRLLLRVGASTDDIRRLGLVLNELENRHANYHEVDARFEGRVIVRGRTT